MDCDEVDGAVKWRLGDAVASERLQWVRYGCDQPMRLPSPERGWGFSRQHVTPTLGPEALGSTLAQPLKLECRIQSPLRRFALIMDQLVVQEASSHVHARFTPLGGRCSGLTRQSLNRTVCGHSTVSTIHGSAQSKRTAYVSIRRMLILH
jgi:hypothetical protein